MRREVLEVSIFWAGELFAVKRFAPGTPVTHEALGLPEVADVVVTAKLVDAGPRFARSRMDLPLGAIGVVAALLHTGTVATFVAAPAPETAAAVVSPRIVTTDVEPVVESRKPPEPARVAPSLACPGVANYLQVNHLTHIDLDHP
jgi:hypothetical protein